MVTETPTSDVGDHVDCGVVLLEDFEHAAQEAIGQQHVAALDFYGCDSVFGRNGLDGLRRLRIIDYGSRRLGFHGVEQSHGDICRFGRLDTCGMQNLGAEVCQLGRLLEVEFSDGTCVVDISRVVVVHTVYVGPDLNLIGTNGGADQRCGIVASAALQVVDLALVISAYETLGQVYRVSRIVVECLFYAALDLA